MASKKKSPTFEIPDTVRRAGQSGWVYRTDGQAAPRKRVTKQAGPGATTPRAAAPAAKKATVPVEPVPMAVTTPAPAGCPVTAEVAPAAPTHGLFGFGLHLAAVPFVVPLYVTAAISRRLGLTEQ